MFRRTLSFVVASALGVALVSAAAGAGAPEPTVSGPVTGGKGQISIVGTSFDPTEVGYVQEEYFLEGTATAYEPVGAFGENGRWKVEPATTAPFATRLIVYRPENAKDFNGTVYVEWLNVSSGFETTAVWSPGHNAIMRSGAAWVGVSTQAVAIQGGQETVGGIPEGGIKAADPERYGTLTHPGDEYSYDIFTQAGLAAAGESTGVDLLDGLAKPDRVLAVGKSQSAFRLVTYANAVQPVAGVFDGILIHSRSRTGTGVAASDSAFGLGDEGMPDRAIVRTDLDVPVLLVQTESDLTVLRSAEARQPDTKKIRTWEVAGAAHVDTYTSGVGFGDLGDGTAEVMVVDPANAGPGPLNCGGAVNAGPAYLVMNAALVRLEDWVRDGTAPSKAKLLATTKEADQFQIVRDENGNAKGGIRTPLVDAPLATLDGEINTGGTFCSLFGHTVPFDAATLAALYPTQADYLQAFDRSLQQAVDAGFILPADAKNLKAAARTITFPTP